MFGRKNLWSKKVLPESTPKILDTLLKTSSNVPPLLTEDTFDKQLKFEEPMREKLRLNRE